MEQLKKLLQDVNLILQKEKVRKEESRKRGERFNVFEMLGVAHYEVTHSKIIAGFMNPQGSHGQGDLFLRLFLQTIENNDKIYLDTSNAKVYTEYGIGVDGRLDIFIENGSHGIIIENKVYAGDQPEQLKRYNDFAKEKYGEGNYMIYYLTLYGHEASGDSANGIAYKCISYYEHIINWLQLCIHECATMPLVRETLVQYLNHIKQLTNQDMDSMNEEKLMELFDSSEKWSAFIGLSNMKNQLLDRLKSRLLNELKIIANKELTNTMWSFDYDKNHISIKPTGSPQIGITIEWNYWNENFPWCIRGACIWVDCKKTNGAVVFNNIKANSHLLPMHNYDENTQNQEWFPFIKQIPSKVFEVGDSQISVEECLYMAKDNARRLAENIWEEVFEPFAKKEYANIMSSCVTQ